MLASKGAESIWGWESPAGKVRAQRRARLILSRIPSGNKQSYLEIGCGTGDFTRLFSQSGASITAVDISEDLTAIARKNLSNYPNVDVITSSFEDLPKDVKYDAVIGSSVLHHLDIQPALTQIFGYPFPGVHSALLNQICLTRKSWCRRIFPGSKRNGGLTGRNCFL